MGDEIHSLDILFKTAADLKAGEATLAQLNKLKSSAKDFEAAEKKFSNRNELDATLLAIKARIQAQKDANEEERRAEVLAQQKALFNKLKDEADQADKTKFSLKGLRTAISQLGNQVLGLPGLGRSITSVLGVSIIAAVALYAKAKRALAEWNEEMKRQEEILARPDFMAAIKARMSVLEQGAVASAMFADKMAHLRDPEEVFQKQLHDEIELLHARSQAVNETAQATHGLAEAQMKHGQGLEEENLKRLLEAGAISYQRYTVLKLELDAKYFKQLTDLEIKNEQERLEREVQLRARILEIENESVEHAKKKQPELVKAAQDARANATAAAVAASTTSENISILEGKKPELQKKVRDLEGEIDQKYGTKLFPWSTPEKGTGLGNLKHNIEAGVDITGTDADLLGKYEDAVNGLAMSEGRLPQLYERLPKQKVAESVAEAAAARAEAAAEANANRISEGQESVDKQGKINSVLNAGAAQAAQGKIGESQFKEFENLGKLQFGPFTGEDIENVAALERLRSMGKPLNDAQQKQISAFEQFAQSIGANTTQLTNLMFRFAGSQTTLTDKVQALETITKNLEARLKATFNK